MNYRTARITLACVALSGCAGSRAPEPAPAPASAPASEPASEPVAVEDPREQPSEVAAAPASQPALEEPDVARLVEDPDPAITRSFSLDAAMVGVCRMGVRGSYAVEEDPKGPVVFRDEGAKPFVQGEPLWVVTAGGGLERARVKRAFRHCPMGDGSGLEEDDRAEILKQRGWSELRCWPAAELIAAKPLQCSVPLSRTPQFKIMFEAEIELSHFVAFPRDMTPPRVVSTPRSMGLYNAVCQDEEKDYDEPGAMIPLSDPETSVSRYARSKYGLSARWAHRVVSYELEGDGARLHVIHAADKKAKRSNTARRDLVLVEREGAFQQVWPRANKRYRGAGDLMRDHFCDLPYWAPQVNVIISPPDKSSLLLLISENDGLESGLWALGKKSLTRRRPFDVEHELEYF